MYIHTLVRISPSCFVLPASFAPPCSWLPREIEAEAEIEEERESDKERETEAERKRQERERERQRERKRKRARKEKWVLEGGRRRETERNFIVSSAAQIPLWRPP